MSKKNYKIYIFISILLLALLSSYQIYPRSGIAFLRNPIGAKANALGTAYTGSVKDPSALFWNPAGLAHISGRKITLKDKKKQAEDDFKDLEKEIESDELIDYGPLSDSEIITKRTFEMEIFVTLSQLSLQRQLGFVGVAFPVYFGSLGIGIHGIRVTGVEGYDTSGISTESLNYILYSGHMGYAFELGPTRIGFALVGIGEDLDGEIIYGGSVDLGIQFFASIYELGASLQNAVGFIQRSTSTSNQFSRLNIILKLSGSVQIPDTGIRIYLGLTSNLDEYQESGPYLNLGISYDIFKYTTILIGLNGSRPSVGLELNFPYITLSYALRPDRLGYGLEHYLDLTLAF